MSELPSCPSHETRDRQTRQGQASKYRHCQGTQPQQVPELCAAAPLPPLEHRMGRSCRQGECTQPEEDAALTLLCAGLGSIHFSPQEQTKIIQALQALHSTPCGQMFSCCVLCVCTGEPEAFESSQLCSHLPPHPGSGQALSLHSSCFLQGGKHMEDKPQGRRGQVGAELLRSCPWAKLLSLVSFRWALHRVHRISTAR